MGIFHPIVSSDEKFLSNRTVTRKNIQEPLIIFLGQVADKSIKWPKAHLWSNLVACIKNPRREELLSGHERACSLPDFVEENDTLAPLKDYATRVNSGAPYL